MPTVTLYNYWRSSASYRVRLALHAKNIPFTYVPVHLLKGEQRAAEHVSRNPNGYVPAIDIDGTLMVESVAICELLEDLFPSPPLYPKEPWARAKVRSVVEIVNSGIQPLINLNVLQRQSSDDDSRAEWARHFITKGLRAVDALIERYQAEGMRGIFSLGDTPTAADLFIVPQLYASRRFHTDLAPFPRLLAVEAEVNKTVWGKAAHPEAQPDFVKP